MHHATITRMRRVAHGLLARIGVVTALPLRNDSRTCARDPALLAEGGDCGTDATERRVVADA
jgi:hypothetical protein